MSKKPKGSDGVGYKRPPKHTRFKPGQSGNPKGRPRGARSLPTVLAEELSRRVTVREGGRTRQKTKLEVFVTRRVNDGIQGSARDADALIALIQKFLPAQGHEPPPETLSDAERQIVERYLSPAPPQEVKPDP